MSGETYAAALRHKLLSKQDEQRLFARYAELRSEHGAEYAKTIAVRNQIVQSNLRLAASSAQRFRAIPFDDLMSEGARGLIIAVERFEADRGLRFSTYAQYWIRHEMRRACENQGSAVRCPVYAQVARRRGEDKRDGVALGGQGISLDAPFSPDGDSNLHDVLAAEDDGADDELGLHRLTGDVRRLVFAVLDQREREVVESRYLRPIEETLREIGERLDVSRERVRQIETEAFGKMRRALNRIGKGRLVDV